MDPKPVPDSGRITEPGEYVLRGDRRIQGVVPPSEAMIRIESGDVTLDGRGHAVVGNGVSDTTAITTHGGATLANVAVENVAVTAWEVGLALRNVERATIRGFEATRNSYGIRLERVARSTVDDCEVRGNLIGVSLDGASSFDRRSNEVTDNRLANVHRENDCD